LISFLLVDWKLETGASWASLLQQISGIGRPRGAVLDLFVSLSSCFSNPTFEVVIFHINTFQPSFNRQKLKMSI
jgi:hypothetical protein